MPFDFCIMYLCYLYVRVYIFFFFFKQQCLNNNFFFVSHPIASHHGSGGTVHAVGMKHALIMDEVDGMAGNEDRGGIQVMKGLCVCSGTVNF